MPLNIVIDGEIYTRQARGGISRLFNETLPRLCDLETDIRLLLFTDGLLRQPLPTHPHIHHRHMPRYELALRPGRLWQPITNEIKTLHRSWWTRRAQAQIWQTTYYTLPKRWHGPLVVLVYDLIEERFADLFNRPKDDRLRQAKRQCILAAERVVCISQTTQRYVCDIYGLDNHKTRVITLAPASVFRILTDAETPADPTLPAAPYLLYVGDRSHYKNFDLLLSAYARWPRRHDIDLVVVGDVWSADETARLAQLGITQRVSLRRGVDDLALRRLYNDAVAFVYPSLDEGFGIPLLEAMMCGCPIVASRIPAAVEVAADCPIYFDPTDEAGLSAALDVAVARGRTEAIRVAGLQRANAYSWDTTAQQMLSIYRELLS